MALGPLGPGPAGLATAMPAAGRGAEKASLPRDRDSERPLKFWTRRASQYPGLPGSKESHGGIKEPPQPHPCAPVAITAASRK
jgi:hypothetical protein